MSPTYPLLKDGPMPQASPHEPSMEEIPASIRRIIASDQALLASESGLRGEAPRPDPNGEVFEPSSRAGAGRTFVSTSTDGSVGAAFNALLASLTREMLRPMLTTWLDDNLPGIVERLVSAEIERVALGDVAAIEAGLLAPPGMKAARTCPYPRNWTVARRRRARSTGATRTPRRVPARPVLTLRKSGRAAGSMSWPR